MSAEKLPEGARCRCSRTEPRALRPTPCIFPVPPKVLRSVSLVGIRRTLKSLDETC